MNPRTITQLNDSLSEDLAWRKREIATTKFLITGGRAHQQPLLLRSGTCILYAHWEGFVKSAATKYLYFVSRQGLNYCDLSANFVALSVRSRLRIADATNRITVHTQVTEFLLSDLRIAADLPWDDAVDAKSNLNWEVLQEVLCMLGLEVANYSTKKAVIDDKLLFYRNRIAHGERVGLEVSDYDIMQATVLELVDSFRNDIENAALTKKYQRPASTR